MKVYEYKGKHYKYLQTAQMKHPTTREWVVAVLYTPMEGSELCIREKEEFEQRFKTIANGK